MTCPRTLRWKNSVLVAVVAATMTLGGCAPAQDAEVLAKVSASSGVAPSTPQSTLAPQRSAAVTAKLPKGTPFDLLIHCGVQYLEYENKEYKAVRPQDSPARLPAPGASTATETGYAHGYLHVINSHTVTFVVADPTVSINGQTITFTITSDSPPSCA